jgi:hypothetical protein
MLNISNPKLPINDRLVKAFETKSVQDDAPQEIKAPVAKLVSLFSPSNFSYINTVVFATLRITF